MNHTLRHKLCAGTGVLSLILGALLVFAPSAGAASVTGVEHEGNLTCKKDLGFAAEGASSSNGEAGDEDTADNGAGLIVDWTFNLDGTIDFAVDDEPPVVSEYWVAVAIVKQGNYSMVYTYDPPAPVPSDEGLEGPPSAPNYDNEFSHIEFCAGEIPDATLRVEKSVTGAEPEDWSFDFTGTGDVGNFELTKADPTSDDFDLEPGDYTITETDDPDSALTDVECTDAAQQSVTTVDVEGGVTVTLEPGHDVTCEFTNDYPEDESASLQIEKAVTGDVPEDGWSFDFTGDGGIGNFQLTDEAPTSDDFDLEPGDYTVTEADVEGVTLTDVTCSEGIEVTEVDGGVTITLEDGDDASCEFENDFAEVEDSSVSPTDTPAAKPSTTPAPAVLDSTVTPAQLAATGSGTQWLATIGMALMALGAVLVLGSRRQAALYRR